MSLHGSMGGGQDDHAQGMVLTRVRAASMTFRAHPSAQHLLKCRLPINLCLQAPFKACQEGDATMTFWKCNSVQAIQCIHTEHSKASILARADLTDNYSAGALFFQACTSKACSQPV
eukprot:1151444-Pelagomonas_calceolata.AAC.7